MTRGSDLGPADWPSPISGLEKSRVRDQRFLVCEKLQYIAMINEMNSPGCNHAANSHHFLIMIPKF